ncbi:MAG TPA: carboxyltransferase domain-containing protein, partial [Bacillales bacterium]
MDYTLSPLGEASVVIQLSEEIDIQTQKKISVIASYLDEHPLPGMIEYIPAFTTITIFYDPMEVLSSRQNSVRSNDSTERLPYDLVCDGINEMISDLPEAQDQQRNVVEIPVCYGGDFGPDLGFVAEHNGLEQEDVIKIHSNGDYLVYMIGFAPG